MYKTNVHPTVGGHLLFNRKLLSNNGNAGWQNACLLVNDGVNLRDLRGLEIVGFDNDAGGIVVDNGNASLKSLGGDERLDVCFLLTFDSYPGAVFTAKVAEVNPVLDTTSRSMGVKLVLDPPDSRIKIGMYCRVKLITESKSGVVAIPREAIVNRSGQESVFVVNGTTVESRPISVGITVDNMVEVVSGLAAGNEVVVSGQTLLDSGSKVNVINRQQGGN